MRYRLSISSADDDVEIHVAGKELKAHSPWAYPHHPKGPWDFEAEPGDAIRVVGWDNWGHCRSVGSIVLTCLDTGESQPLHPGLNLGCGFPALHPNYHPGVAFFDASFQIMVPHGQEERDRRSRCLEWLNGLVSALTGGNVNVDGCLVLQMLENLFYTSVDSPQSPRSMGWGWHMGTYQRVEEVENGQALLWSDGAGSFEKWRKEGDLFVPAFPNNYIEAVRRGDGTCELTLPDQVVSYFDRQDRGGRLLRQVDRNGNTVRYEYEPGADGRLARVSDDRGRVLVFVHGSDGQPLSIDDCRGGVRSTRFEYYGEGSARGRLRAVSSPGGERVEFVYDSNGRLHQVKRPREGHPEGVVDLQVTYYSDGRVHTEDFHVVPGQQAGLRRNTYTYDPTGRQTTVVARDFGSGESDEGVERTVVATYDERFQITALRDPKGNLTTFEYGDERNPYLVTRIVDPNLNPTVFEYNAQGNRTRTRDALGNVTEVKYAEDLLGEATPPLHRNLPYEVHRPPVTVVEHGVEVRRQFTPTRLHYDDRGNLEALVDPRGNPVQVERGSDGQVTAVTDRLGHTTRFAYNERGNLVTVTTPGTPGETLPLTTRFEYHPEHFDRLQRTVAPGGRPEKFEFDLDERLVALTEARGNTLRFSYRDGQLASVLAPPNHGSANQERLTEYRYDIAGRLEEVLADVDRFQQGQSRVRYAYDGFDQLRAMARTMNGARKTTRYSYDVLGRPVQTVDPLGRASSTAYAPYCKEFTSTSAAGRVNTFHFDALCRPTETSNREGSTKFEHDEWGRLVRVTQPGGSGALYGKGVRGRARYGDGEDLPETRRYDYDELDRLVRITFPDGKFQSYDYDAEGRLAALTDVHGRRTDYTYHDDNRLRTVCQEGQLFRYEYGLDGRLQTLHYPASTQVRADYHWDDAGNLEVLHYKRGGVTLHRMEYLYDASGNRSHFIDTPMDQRQKTVYEYNYDRLDRLTRVYKDQVLVSAYGFDESDNRAWMDKWLDGALRRHEYTYDAADQILSVTENGLPKLAFEHDPDGNLTLKRDLVTGRSDTDEWTDAGALKTITTQVPGEPTATTSNSYDAGRIRKRKLAADGTQTDYYYSGLPALSETVKPPASSGAPPELRSYVVGHQALGYYDDRSFFYFLPDALGSVRELVDGEGSVRATYTYDEYGASAFESGYLAALGVTPEPAANLGLHGLRFYDAATGRFLSQDPVQHLGSLNRFAYGNNNPILYSDADGRDAVIVSTDGSRTTYTVAYEFGEAIQKAPPGSIKEISITGHGSVRAQRFDPNDASERNGVVWDPATGAITLLDQDFSYERDFIELLKPALTRGAEIRLSGCNTAGGKGGKEGVIADLQAKGDPKSLQKAGSWFPPESSENIASHIARQLGGMDVTVYGVKGLAWFIGSFATRIEWTEYHYPRPRR